MRESGQGLETRAPDLTQHADLRATRGILETLFYLSPERNLLYVTDTHGGIPTRKFEHLLCFYPGLLALALHTLENDTSI